MPVHARERSHQTGALITVRRVAETDETEPCRICGTAECTPVVTVEAGATSTWVRCAGCGVQRIAPYPSEQELTAYYDDHYREKDDFGEAGFEVSHKLRYSDAYSAQVAEEYRLSLADVGLTPDVSTRVLDYGCADGGFLDYLRNAGIPAEQLTGVDVSAEMIAVVNERGLHGVTVAEQDTIARQRFDLITLWDVIEHVPDPVGTLSWLRQLLGEGGRLFMQTPRVGLLSDLLGARFEHYLPLEHLHLFTRDALVGAAERAGFALVAAASFGANAPASLIPQPYKAAYDALAKDADEGATQLVVLG